ncbi:hypothetical protein C8F04DRAFT_1401687 [Mycena alexandri]|uniref:Uncharacterized protein n=1 Tax=Mycena alexandri TaxID=1745969 RepID=A0AAD6WWA4_9AGAR|nr:hypothetical protein C8F04DRAFT_1305084 [Mycena alexandri]KAJ7023544.1 hypothetical protein C8F04DRAFT_1401687 [Mycena alexandri]
MRMAVISCLALGAVPRNSLPFSPDNLVRKVLEERLVRNTPKEQAALDVLPSKKFVPPPRTNYSFPAAIRRPQLGAIHGPAATPRHRGAKRSRWATCRDPYSHVPRPSSLANFSAADSNQTLLAFALRLCAQSPWICNLDWKWKDDGASTVHHPATCWGSVKRVAQSKRNDGPVHDL